MQETMQEIVKIITSYGSLDNYEPLIDTPSKVRKYLSKRPLIGDYSSSNPSKEDIEAMQELLTLLEKLEEIATYVETYCGEHADQNHWKFVVYKSKTDEKLFAFVSSWNSWDSRGTYEDGVYEVKSKVVTEYDIVWK